jgi:hypothetical protein
MFLMLYASKFVDRGPILTYSAKAFAQLAKQPLLAFEVEYHAKID